MIGKRALRSRFLTFRKAIPENARDRANAIIFTRASAHKLFASAAVVHCYVSMDSEVDTHRLIEHSLAQGKRVVVPIWTRGTSDTLACEISSLNSQDFVTGGFGLAVPRVVREVALSEVDLIFVPMLAFQPVSIDATAAHRLGYGAGYYDRLLSRTSAPRIGLAFALQRTDELMVEPHDQLLDEVITD